jgi:DNA-binding response OmpR family regulator
MQAIRARPGERRPLIVAVTASAFDDTREAIFAAGADAWLRKPCQARELLETLARHLGLRYHYRATSPAPGSRPAERPLRRLREELSDPLREAACLADYEQLRALIDALPPADAAMAAELSRLADSYAYDRIEALLR